MNSHSIKVCEFRITVESQDRMVTSQSFHTALKMQFYTEGIGLSNCTERHNMPFCKMVNRHSNMRRQWQSHT